MAQPRTPDARFAASIARVDRIEKGWTVYDAVEHPIGTITDVDRDRGRLLIDGRSAGFEDFDVPPEAVRDAGDNEVHLTLTVDTNRSADGDRPQFAAAPDDASHPSSTSQPTAAATTSTRRFATAEPPGPAPTWADEEQASGFRRWLPYAGLMAAGGLSAAGYSWWRRRQRKPSWKHAADFLRDRRPAGWTWSVGRSRGGMGMPGRSEVAMLLPFGKGRAVPGRVRRLAAANLPPHPHWLDAGPNALSLVNQGWVVWVVGVLVARLLGVTGSRRAMGQVPASVAAALLAQYPLKRVAHRPRPLSATIRSWVLRERGHGRASLPSGHAAAAFAGAWAAGTIWPRWAPAFLGVASAIGANRVRVGAHRASDVAGGAAVGIAVAEIIHGATSRVLD